MSENEDKSQKTEEPTPRRIEKAREEGQVPRSKEVNNWLVLSVATLMLITVFPLLGDGITEELGSIIYDVNLLVVEGTELIELISDLGVALALYVLIPCTLFTLTGLSGGFFQHGFLVSTKPITPKLERISLIKGLGRLFSQQTVVEFAKGILKISIVGAVGFLTILPDLSRVDTFVTISPRDIIAVFTVMAAKMMAAMLAVYLFITIADTIYQFYAHKKRLRMSRQEVKEEFRQSEGDPQIKARIRQIRNERHRRRLVESMEQADVVVTNPTHFAVALSYDPANMDAPEVVAKGADHMALLIRKIASDKDIDIIENPPLARALYDTTEEGQAINPEHYQAVAAIVSQVFKLRNRPLN